MAIVRDSGAKGDGKTDNTNAFHRAVHWNIHMTGGSNEWLFTPAYMPSGTIASGQGGEIFKPDTKLWHMPDGPKGCLVINYGKAPTLPDLFEAQLKHRLANTDHPD